MSFRRTGLVLLLALTAGCAAAPAREAAAPVTTLPAPPPPMAEPGTPLDAGAAAPQESAKDRLDAREGSSTSGKSTVTSATVVQGALGGAISQTEIRDVVVKNGALFDACYRVGAGGAGQFVATVAVKATIGPTGKVNVADVTRSTAKNKQVDTCVADAFKKMQFPPPKGGVTSVITFPIEFNGLEEVRN